jgi:hypothetical protein
MRELLASILQSTLLKLNRGKMKTDGGSEGLEFA